MHDNRTIPRNGARTVQQTWTDQLPLLSRSSCSETAVHTLTSIAQPTTTIGNHIRNQAEIKKGVGNMSRYHVKVDGSMGICTAQEGNCPFGGEAGTKHFTNEAEARKYSEELIGRNSGNHSLKKSSKPSTEPNITSTSMSSDDDMISEETMKSIYDHTHDEDFIDSLDTYEISMIVLGAVNGDEDYTNEERIGRLAAAVSKDPDTVRKVASRYAQYEDKADKIISQLNTIAEVADEDTGRKARGVQADIAWRRDGQPYYENWERTHLDEATYDGDPVYEPHPFGPDDLSDDELKEKSSDLTNAMAQLNDAMDDINAMDDEDLDRIDEFDANYLNSYEKVYSFLHDTDEIDNPHYWDDEPNQWKQSYGVTLQSARELLNEANIYDDYIEDFKKRLGR